jgi:hypothetical protein
MGHNTNFLMAPSFPPTVCQWKISIVSPDCTKEPFIVSPTSPNRRTRGRPERKAAARHVSSSYKSQLNSTGQPHRTGKSVSCPQITQLWRSEDAHDSRIANATCFSCR